MYIAPGQGHTAPRGQSFDVNRNFLSLVSGNHFSVENSVLTIDSEKFQSSPIFSYSNKFLIAGYNGHITTF